MDFSLSPFAPESLILRDGFGRPVLRQPAYSPYSGCIWCLHAGFLPISAAASIYLYQHTYAIEPVPSLSDHHSITDGVHCQESAGTEPVVLKFVPVTTDAAFSGITMDQLMFLLFPTPTTTLLI